jgi:uncharacterized protein YjiS (DUF1127 family)
MSKIYIATVVAIFITTSLATNLLVVGARGPVTPDLSSRMRAGSRRLSRRVKSFVDNWVAAMLSHRERQASAWALQYMSDRELKDIGIYRGRIGRVEGHAGQLSPVTARAAFSIAHPLEEGLQ